MKKKHATVQFPSRFKCIGVAFRKIPWMTILITAGLVWGCTGQKQENTKEILIQVNDRKITIAEFNDKFDKMNDDIPSSAEIEPADQSEMRRYLLNQLIEKLILMERAKELDLNVSDVELEKAVDKIKMDYPDDEFKQVLLEQNVSFRQWKEELRIRILLEKVIEKEISPLISLKSDDISAYYEKHYPADEKGADSAPVDEDFNETLLQLVSKQKKEEAYQSWIVELQKRYKIDVNTEAWEKINASKF
jgi:hypothetical protein